MNSRSIAILGALVAIVVAAAAWLGLSREQAGTDAQQLYPQAKSQLDKLTAVRLYAAGDVLKLELSKGANGWTVAQRHDYLADPTKVRQLIVGIAEAKIVEEKTSNSASYATLGVEDVSSADAKGTRVEWVGAKETNVNVILGKEAGTTNAYYVRRVGEQPSWLVKADVFVSTEPDEWLNKEVINISADRVQSATVTVGSASYTASKSTRADANFKVEGLKKGQELSSDSAANSVATALANLTLNDVRPFAELSDAKPNATATFKTFDGVVITLAGFQRDDQRWVHARAAFDTKLAEQFGIATLQGAPVDTEGNAKSANTAPNREQEAKQLDARIKEWAYEVPEYQYNAIFRPLDELLKR